MDRFNVISLVGEGSFGRVYKAIEISSKSIVALKIISKVIIWKLYILKFNLIALFFLVV